MVAAGAGGGEVAAVATTAPVPEGGGIEVRAAGLVAETEVECAADPTDDVDDAAGGLLWEFYLANRA